MPGSQEITQLPAQQLRVAVCWDQTCHILPWDASSSESACLLSQGNHLCWTLTVTTHLPLISSLSVPAGSLPNLPVLPHLVFGELSILILIGPTNNEGVRYVQSTRGQDGAEGPLFGPRQWFFFTRSLQDAILKEQWQFFLERHEKHRICISKRSRSMSQLLQAGITKQSNSIAWLAGVQEACRRWSVHSTTRIQRME